MDTLKSMADELHKPVKRKFPRRKVYVSGIDSTWCVDLVDMQEWAKFNNDFKYILMVVDVFSRYAWARPLKSKSARDVFNAFMDIIDTSGRKPDKVWSDEGKEFVNKTMQSYLKKNNMILYSTHGEHKASFVERLNRTIKTSMWKEFTKHNTRRWVDMLPKLISNYNRKKHGALGMSPESASKESNEVELWNEQFGEVFLPSVSKPKLKKGDMVRISRIRGTFEKGYLPGWSHELFFIAKVLRTVPPTYKIVDWNKEPIEGSFYEQELQKTTNDTFLIEDVVKTRVRNGKREAYVKYVGYDNKWNEWIPADNLRDLPVMK